MEKWFVYLLYSDKVKKHYIGSTNDLDRRLKEHNSGRSKFTSMAKDWVIKYFEEYFTEKEARSNEIKIKKNKKLRKEFYEKQVKHGLPV